MDAIEQGKKVITESATPVVEYKGGTDAEKIKNWQQHIKNFDNFPKAQDDARQAAKKAQPGAKFYKTDDKPQKEGMGSIARALMQSMGMDDQEIEEEGNYPLDPQGYVPRGDVPAGPGMSDPMGALKHAWKYRTDDQGRLIGKRARAELDNPDPSVTGDANIAGAANAGAAAAPAQPDVGTPELNIGQGSQNGPIPPAGGQSADPGYKPGETVDTWREPSGVSQTTFTPPGPTPAPGPTPPKPVVGGQSAKPTGMNPAAFAYAERLGLLTGGKPDPAKVKAFQQQQGIAADGIIGPQTIGSLISAGSKLQSGGAGRQDPRTVGGQSPAPSGPATQGQVRAVDQAIAAKDRASQPAPKRPTQVGAPSKAVQDWDAKYSTTHDPKTGMPLTGGQPAGAQSPAPTGAKVGRAGQAQVESIHRQSDDAVLALIKSIKL